MKFSNKLFEIKAKISLSAFILVIGACRLGATETDELCGESSVSTPVKNVHQSMNEQLMGLNYSDSPINSPSPLSVRTGTTQNKNNKRNKNTGGFEKPKGRSIASGLIAELGSPAKVNKIMIALSSDGNKPQNPLNRAGRRNRTGVGHGIGKEVVNALQTKAQLGQQTPSSPLVFTKAQQTPLSPEVSYNVYNNDDSPNYFSPAENPYSRSHANDGYEANDVVEKVSSPDVRRAENGAAQKKTRLLNESAVTLFSDNHSAEVALAPRNKDQLALWKDQLALWKDQFALSLETRRSETIDPCVNEITDYKKPQQDLEYFQKICLYLGAEDDDETRKMIVETISVQPGFEGLNEENAFKFLLDKATDAGENMEDFFTKMVEEKEYRNKIAKQYFESKQELIVRTSEMFNQSYSMLNQSYSMIDEMQNVNSALWENLSNLIYRTDLLQHIPSDQLSITRIDRNQMMNPNQLVKFFELMTNQFLQSHQTNYNLSCANDRLTTTNKENSEKDKKQINIIAQLTESNHHLLLENNNLRLEKNSLTEELNNLKAELLRLNNLGTK
ncbi:MAG: hypothetical protein Q8S21_00735 [Candidatus Paracaedibacteraceae bacterium]|nr:hypothetical protein [Candidatus Paracaedibacteraceae bacterium]